MSSIKQTSVEVGTMPSLLTDIDNPTNAFDGGKVSFAFFNSSGSVVYIGGSDVTFTTGIPLPAGAVITLDAPIGADIFGITEYNSADVRILQIG